VVVGGPTDGDNERPGSTVKLVALVAVPADVVTEIGPVDAAAGTVALTFVAEFTVKVAFAPLNVTLFAPVNPEPVTVTLVPIVPDVGLKLVIVCAEAVAAQTAADIKHPNATTRRLHDEEQINGDPSQREEHRERLCHAGPGLMRGCARLRAGRAGSL
jgi:hypothetical protein